MAELSVPQPVEGAPLAEPKNMRTFMIIWFGQLISLLGSGLTGFAIGVWLYQSTGQATPFAITVLLGNLPQILLLPVAGSLADRWNRRWLMILADTGNAITTLLLFVLLLGGQLQIWQVYILVFLGSLCGAFQEPAYQASISMIVPKADLARANGLSQTSQALGSIITPLIAGGLFVAIGMQGIILIDFVTYFFAIGALLLVKIPQPAAAPAPAGQKNQLWSDVVFGWQYLRARSGLFGLLLYFAMVNFVLNFAAVLLGPLVLSRHSPTVFGIIQTVFGAGMLVGSLVLSAWRGPKQRIPVVIGIVALSCLGMGIVGVHPHPFFPALGLFILMASVPVASGLSQAVFQTKVERTVQGRVFAMRSMVARSMMPVAFLLSGFLADSVFEPLMAEDGALAETFIGALLGVGVGRGIGLMFVLAGLAGVLISGLVYLNPRVRLVESELPDALPDAPQVSPAAG